MLSVKLKASLFAGIVGGLAIGLIIPFAEAKEEKCVCPEGVSQGTVGPSTLPMNTGYTCSVASNGSASIGVTIPVSGSGTAQGSTTQNNATVCFFQITRGPEYKPFKSTTSCEGVKNIGPVEWVTTYYEFSDSGSACKVEKGFLFFSSDHIICPPKSSRNPDAVSHDNYDACPGCNKVYQ